MAVVGSVTAGVSVGRSSAAWPSPQADAPTANSSTAIATNRTRLFDCLPSIAVSFVPHKQNTCHTLMVGGPVVESRLPGRAHVLVTASDCTQLRGDFCCIVSIV